MPRTIIVEAEEQVACPKCSHRFPLSEGISRQTIEHHAEALERSLAERKKKLEAELAVEARARFEAERKAMEDAIQAKESALAAFRSGELELRRQLRELEDAKRNQDLEYQRKLDAERKRLEAEARLAAGEELGRREAQWKAQLESAQREAADLKRKLEQGSQQLQGEALELSLVSALRAAFPLDEIVPVPKGMSGADLLQRVRLPSGHCCGPKDDQHAIGAELAVIVTAAMLSVVGDLQGIGEDGVGRLDAVASLPEIVGE